MGNSWKRAAAAGLAAACLLSGCAKKEELSPQDPTPVEIWHYYNGPQKLAFDQMVSEFNDTVGLEKGIVVEAFSQGGVNELADKLMASAKKEVGSARLPDAAAAYADTAWELDRMGMLADAGRYLTDGDLARFVPDYLEEGRFSPEDKLKIYPVAKSTETMMLNLTDWRPFAEATGAQMETLQTAEGVVEVARAYYEWTDSLTETPDDGKAMFGRDALANYMLVGYHQIAGEDMIRRVGDGVELSLDRDALRRLWDNFYVPYVNGWFSSFGRFRSDDVKTGDLIALVGSTSGAAYFPEAVTLSSGESYPIEAAVLPMPVFEGGFPCEVQQGAGMVVFSSEEKTERAAVAFLQWFTEPERNIAFSVKSGYLPVLTEANDVGLVRAALKGGAGETLLGDVLGTAIETVKESHLCVTPPFEGGAQARKVLEYHMLDAANQARVQVAELRQRGVSRADALARVTGDGAFDSWYEAFSAELAPYF